MVVLDSHQSKVKAKMNIKKAVFDLSYNWVIEQNIDLVFVAYDEYFTENFFQRRIFINSSSHPLSGSSKVYGQ